MVERRYIPQDYVDEVCMPLRSSASDWIMYHDAFYHLVADRDYTDEDDVDRPGGLLISDATVEFDWQDDYGSRIIKVFVGEDGELTHDPIGFIPSSVNMFWIDNDTDTMMDDLTSCLREYHAMDGFEDGQEIELSVAEWGTASFRFVVDDGGARFVLVEGQ